jgi:hypothetical protein
VSVHKRNDSLKLPTLHVLLSKTYYHDASLKKTREAVSGHVGTLPIPYPTTDRQPTFFNLYDTCGCSIHSPHGRTFPTALDPLYCNRDEIRKFAEDALNDNVRARKLVEPILGEKENEAALCVHAPFTEWVLAVSVYRKGG